MKESPNLTNARALLPRRDHYGKLYTLIVKTDGLEKSSLTPLQLLDIQLRRTGSSLKGAKDAALFIMGTTTLHPLLLQLHPDIHTWFPTESPRNETCAYLAINHIRDIQDILAYSDTETIVHGCGAYDVVIPVIQSKVRIRYNEALRFVGWIYCNHYLKQDFNYPEQEKIIVQCAELHEDYLLN